MNFKHGSCHHFIDSNVLLILKKEKYTSKTLFPEKLLFVSNYLLRSEHALRFNTIRINRALTVKQQLLL